MSGIRHPVTEQFEDEAQRHEAVQLGMWLFVASELLLFGALFLGLTVYRVTYPQIAREASHHLHLWIGGANTVILLTSSLFMVLAVIAARAGALRRSVALLLLTAALGLVFLALKGYEYRSEYREGLMPGIGPEFPMDVPPAELFFNLYFAATGLHAAHLTIGVAAVLAVAWLVGRGRLGLRAKQLRVESLGLYWHFVDIVWVFLYPTLYLVK